MIYDLIYVNVQWLIVYSESCLYKTQQTTYLYNYYNDHDLVVVSYLQSVIEDILDFDIRVTQTDAFLQYVSGAQLIPGSVPLAHRYGGHQVRHIMGPWCSFYLNDLFFNIVNRK